MFRSSFGIVFYRCSEDCASVRDGIVSAAAPGMASAEPSDGQEQSFDRAVPAE